MGFIRLDARTCAKFSKLAYLQRVGILFLALFTIMAFSALSPLKALAGQTTVAWDTDTSSGVIGYKLYYGTSSGGYDQSVDVGNVTSYAVAGLTDGQTYYFAAKAYDSAGNLSGYSNEASTTISSTVSSTYTITATAFANGTISAINNSNSSSSSSGTTVTTNVTVSSGSSQSFSITPNSGYSVASVTVDGNPVGAVTTYTFNNVSANHTITATFTANTVNTYTLTSTAGTGGTISPSGAITVNSGASETYTITPNTGYYTVSVSLDGTVVGGNTGSYTYTLSNITANHTVSATFALSTYDITVSAGTGGSISPTSARVTYGGSQTFSITPSTGYSISAVTVDGTSVGAVSSYTFSNVTANHTISATFTANSVNKYTITASAGAGGSISPASALVAYGGSQAFSITPSTGYSISAVKVDGTSVGAVSSYTFSNVTANHTISATFIKTKRIKY